MISTEILTTNFSKKKQKFASSSAKYRYLKMFQKGISQFCIITVVSIKIWNPDTVGVKNRSFDIRIVHS